MRTSIRHITIRRVMVAAVALAVASAGQSPLGAGPPSDAIVFGAGRAGNTDLLAVAPAGGTPANLTASVERELDPAVRDSDGAVAFARIPPGQTRASIFVRNPDGSVVQVSDAPAADRHPAWSPDGVWLAFVRSFPPEGRSQIWKVRVAGGGLTALTGTGPGLINGAPVWYEDGGTEWIAFTRSETGASWPMLRRIDTDGFGGKILTGDGQNEIVANPDWADVGGTGTIAYEWCCPAGGGDIRSIDDDGVGPPMSQTATSGTDESDPVWSPESPAPLSLAVSQAPAGGGDRDIATIPVGGGPPASVSPDPRADLGPSWSPVPIPGGGSLSAGAPAGAGLRSGKKGGKVKRPRKKVVEKVTKGVTLFKLRRPGPLRVFALQVNPRKKPSLDVALARGRLKGLQPTKGIARRHGAIAAINGDFALAGGIPAHAFAEDGDLKQSSFMSGPTFALKRNQRRAFVDDADVRVTSVETGSGDVYPVDRWNSGAPVYGEIAGYTAAGRGVQNPAAFQCGASLAPSGPRRWAPAKQGVVRDYAVQAAGCFGFGLAPQGEGVVLTAEAGSKEAFLLRSLTPGEAVSLTWSFGWSGILDGIGGFPLLVANKRIVVGACGDLCGRAPRTGIGVTKQGHFLLVVVDGRRPKWSRGMTIRRFAREMKKLGAVRAMNLDGGGSSTLVVRKKVVNRPSDGKPRAVSSAVLVLPGKDPGNAFTAAVGRGGRGSRPGKRSARFFDPASTGGFLDAVASGAFGPAIALPPELASLLRAYRARR